MSDSTHSEEPPERLGRYAIQREIARGGMGVVYEGRDPEGGAVAIKLMRQQRSGEDDHRFRLEARATARMEHPNLVRTLEFGYHEERPFLVMDLVEGQTLADRLQERGPLPVAEVIRIGRELAAGLEHAHAEGVLHRDIKPENVLLDDADRVRLTDFGLAKLTGAATQSLLGSVAQTTLEGQLIGTPQYMSPEQVDGETSRYDARSEVYGVGATLYTLLCGAPPFSESAKLIHLLNAIARKDPRDPREVRPGLPAGLVEVVLRCLEKSQEDRFASAAALEEALRELDAQGERPRPARLGSALLATGALLAALGLSLWGLSAVAGSPLTASPSPTPPAVAWRTGAGIRDTETITWRGGRLLARGHSLLGTRQWSVVDPRDGSHQTLNGLTELLRPAWDSARASFAGIGSGSRLLQIEGQGPPLDLGSFERATVAWAHSGLVVVGDAAGAVHGVQVGQAQPAWTLSPFQGRLESEPLGLDLDGDPGPDHLLLGTCAGEVGLLRLEDGQLVARTLVGAPLQGESFAPFGGAPGSPRVLVNSRSGLFEILRVQASGIVREKINSYTAPFPVVPEVQYRDGEPIRIVTGTRLGLVAFRPDLSVEWVSGVAPGSVPRGGVAIVDVDGDGLEEFAVAEFQYEPTTVAIGVYDDQGRRRASLPLGHRGAWLQGGSSPGLIGHDLRDVIRWKSLPRLPAPPAPSFRRLTSSVLGGAFDSARDLAAQLPESERVSSWDGVAAWHLGQRATFESLYDADPERFDAWFNEDLETLRLSGAQRGILHAARRSSEDDKIPPVLIPETQEGLSAVRGVDLEATPYLVDRVRIRTQGERGKGVFQGSGWLELEFTLAEAEKLDLVFNHQSYLDFGLAWSEIAVTMDESPVTPRWCANQWGSVDRLSLGELQPGTHRIRFTIVGRSLTIWRLYYARLEPAAR